MMKFVYLDNGATSFPKAPGVVDSIVNYLTEVGVNVNRGAYSKSYDAEDVVYETRELICQLFNFNKPENVIFTKNITESLNVVIKGLFQRGDHVIVSAMEHNAVMRPLNALGNKIEYSKVNCNEIGELNVESLQHHLKQNTKAVIMTHASNVSGTIFPLDKVGQFCKANNLYFIIDGAQSAGIIPIDFNKLNADFFGFTGHKSLLGPQGIGGFIATDELLNKISPLIDGGTGSLSDEEFQPSYLPDKFEAGTLNIPGIYGLNASLKYLLTETVNEISTKQKNLFNHFLEGLLNIKGIDIIGPATNLNRTSLISLNFPGRDNGLIAHELNQVYGIMTRSGMHCAPSAHKVLNTFPQGTVRFSLSHFTTLSEIDYTIDAINQILK